MIKSILAVLALTATFNASAYYVWGMGEETCGQYIGAMGEYEHRGQSTDHLAHVNWIKGFITGINWAKESDIAKDLDVDTVRQWVDGYCRANLQDNIAGAAAAMVTEFESLD